MRVLHLEGSFRRIQLGVARRAWFPAGEALDRLQGAALISSSEFGDGEHQCRWRFAARESAASPRLRVVLPDTLPKGAIATAWYGSSAQGVMLGGEQDWWLSPADQPLEIAVRNGPLWQPTSLCLPLDELLNLLGPRQLIRPSSYPELLVRASGRPTRQVRPLLRPVLDMLEGAGVLSVLSVLPLGSCARVRMCAAKNPDGALALLEGLGMSLSAAGSRYSLAQQTAPERAVIGFDDFHEVLLRVDGHRDFDEIPNFSAHTGMLVAIEVGAADPTRNSVFHEGSVQNIPVEPGPYAERYHCDGVFEDERYKSVVHATMVAGLLVGKSYDVSTQNARSLPHIEEPHLRYGGLGVNPTGGVVRVVSTEAITALLGACDRYSSSDFELPTWEQALTYAERSSWDGPTQVGHIVSVSLTSLVYSPQDYHGLYGISSDGSGLVPSLCGVTDEWAFAHDLVLVGAVQNKKNGKYAGVPSSCINAVGVGAFADSIYGLIGAQSDVPVNVHAVESGTLRVVSWFKPEILGPLEARVPRIRPGWEWGDGAGPRGSDSPYSDEQRDEMKTHGFLSPDDETIFGIGTSVATPIVASAAAWIWSLLGTAARSELVTAILYCTAAGYPPVTDVERSDTNPGDGKPRNPGVVRGFYRRAGGARDSVFGIVNFDSIGRFFRRCELHDPEDWRGVNVDHRLGAFVAGYKLVQISTTDGDAFDHDVSPQELSIGSPRALSEQFSDSTVQDWRFMGSMLLPSLRKSLQYSVVVTWKVPVDMSPLSSGQRRVLQNHLRDHELLASVTLPEDFSPARVATPHLLLRLRVWDSGKGDAALDHHTVSFISGAPYRAFRFAVPDASAAPAESTDTVNVGLEFYWPTGVDVRHLPRDVAIAMIGQRAIPSATENPTGGLRIERDTVVEYEMQIDPQTQVPVEVTSDYVAFRPVWR